MTSANHGFTLIELVVVVTIIALLGAGAMQFGSMLDLGMSTNLQILDELESREKSGGILYKFIFKTGDGGYIISDFWGEKYQQKLDLGFKTGEGILILEDRNGIKIGPGDLDFQSRKTILFQGNKPIDKPTLTENHKTIQLNSKTPNPYTITGKVEGEQTNKLSILYYGDDIILSEINTKSDKSGSKYDQITIEKYGYSRKFSDQNGDGIDVGKFGSIYLFFSNGGAETMVKIDSIQ